MMKRQLGQAMAEYVIVCAALISALFWGANVECDGGDSGSNKCIAKLLTVMHDNFDGYSSSISAVQKYGDYAASGTPVEGGGSPGTVGGPGSGGGSVDGSGSEGLTDAKQVTSNDGSVIYGDVLADGSVVDGDGNIVGFYSETDNTYTDNGGGSASAIATNVVKDEEGNVLHLRAVTSCAPSLPGIPTPVYSWGYVSKATGKVFNSLTKTELDIGGLCTQASFKVVKDGQEQGGRILNGQYFASVFAINVSTAPLNASGEVVYWEDLGLCSVMVTNWDGDLESGLDDQEEYDARVAILNDSDRNIGEIDPVDYFNQTQIYGVPTEANGCPSAYVLSAP